MGDAVVIRPSDGEATDAANPYIAYTCLMLAGHRAVVSNGAHTDVVGQKLPRATSSPSPRTSSPSRPKLGRSRRSAREPPAKPVYILGQDVFSRFERPVCSAAALEGGDGTWEVATASSVSTVA